MLVLVFVSGSQTVYPVDPALWNESTPDPVSPCEHRSIELLEESTICKEGQGAASEKSRSTV
jgi:hypothetical protein